MSCPSVIDVNTWQIIMIKKCFQEQRFSELSIKIPLLLFVFVQKFSQFLYTDTHTSCFFWLNGFDSFGNILYIDKRETTVSLPYKIERLARFLWDFSHSTTIHSNCLNRQVFYQKIY